MKYRQAYYSSVQFSSVAQLCLTLHDPIVCNKRIIILKVDCDSEQIQVPFSDFSCAVTTQWKSYMLQRLKGTQRVI